jgi:Purple acid Phosphatase, N-terminal domain
MRAGAIAKVLVLSMVVALSLAMSAQVVRITSGPVIETATGNSATIAWSTNDASSSRVWYGTEMNNLTQMAEAPYGATAHRVQLNNLKPGTTYYFRVESGVATGGTTGETQGVMSFRTPAAGQGPIHNEKATLAEKGLANEENGSVRMTGAPTIEYVDNSSAIISWTTNRLGSTRLNYGTNPNDLTQFAEAPWGVGGLTHRVQLHNLQPSTTYYFKVETGQAEGTGGAEVESARNLSFKTTAPGAPALRNQPAH